MKIILSKLKYNIMLLYLLKNIIFCILNIKNNIAYVGFYE